MQQIEEHTHRLKSVYFHKDPQRRLTIVVVLEILSRWPTLDLLGEAIFYEKSVKRQDPPQKICLERKVGEHTFKEQYLLYMHDS